MTNPRIEGLNGPIDRTIQNFANSGHSDKIVNVAIAAIVIGSVTTATYYGVNYLFPQTVEKKPESKPVSDIKEGDSQEVIDLKVQLLLLTKAKETKEVGNNQQQSTINQVARGVLGLGYAYIEQFVRQQAKDDFKEVKRFLSNGVLAIGAYITIGNIFGKK